MPLVEEFAWAYYVYVQSRQLDPWLYITVRVRTSQQVDRVHPRRRKPVLPKTLRLRPHGWEVVVVFRKPQ